MALLNFRKETSERSDVANWAKALLAQKSGYFLESKELIQRNRQALVAKFVELLSV